jgi:tRNA A-37 threonylcarbamoyl transferase component Bud32
MFPYFKTWRVFSPWNKTAVELCFSSMRAVFQLDGKIISKSSQSEIFSQNIDGKTYFVKRYFRSKNIGSWLGFSRFQNELRNQLWFNQQGIPSARVVAFGEHRMLLKILKGVLITEGVNDTQELAEIAKKTPEKFAEKHWRDAIIAQLADITAQLHHARFCHNDLHWRNILVQQTSTNHEAKIFLIDCPSGKKLTWPFLNYRKLKDLANLDKLAPTYLSRTQRLAFFLAYRDINKLTPKDKIMVREVMQHKENRKKRKAKAKK